MQFSHHFDVNEKEKQTNKQIKCMEKVQMHTHRKEKPIMYIHRHIEYQSETMVSNIIFLINDIPKTQKTKPISKTFARTAIQLQFVLIQLRLI